MQMTFRWYGEGNDSITPQMIKQIPGVTGLVWALHHKQAGEVWEVEEIEEARKHPIVFDEDCEELSPAMVKAFKSATISRNRRKNA